MTITGSISTTLEITPEGRAMLSRLFSEEPRYVMAITGPADGERRLVRGMRRIYRGEEQLSLQCGDLSIRISAVTVNDREIWPILRRKRS